jgi:uncharacterized protein YuzE
LSGELLVDIDTKARLVIGIEITAAKFWCSGENFPNEI